MRPTEKNNEKAKSQWKIPLRLSLWRKLEYDGKKRRHFPQMPSKPAAKFKKVTAENAVIHKKQKIVTAKSVVKSKKWRQKMPSYIKSDGKICRHFTLLGVSGAVPLTRGILTVTS